VSPAAWTAGPSQHFWGNGFGGHVCDGELFVAANRKHRSIKLAREESSALTCDHEYDALGDAACLLKVVVGQEDFAARARGVGPHRFEVRKARVVLLRLTKSG
jgi:hypothetical protein